MAPRLGRYNATIRLIESTQLTATEHSIWRAFLDEAVDPEYAAQYIWERIHDRPSHPPEQVLHELKLDWKRVVTKFQTERAPISPPAVESVARRDQVSSDARTGVEARDDSHCFMLRQKPSDPSTSTCFYSEYWEFTKLMYGVERFPEIQQIIRDAFTEDDYQEQLDAETLLWNVTPFGV
ncbi:LOW QUALITY PROTEIN: hypothetical protein IFM46972_02947 [Aspergillus udagawae]|uniref:Uncharacterized protein n=1 Tax=Aspergillus udagawae TaxID=91492 RepID=A0A8H3NEG7_9EURO|nr:LOW QUALITY PROTEIN: hypothetical protein IFM46972_02947 [Aspergillus udagawae]